MRRLPTLLVASLAGTALLCACDSSLPPATPTPAVYKQSINITHADYDAAVRLWQSQKVTEYEVTTREVSERSSNGYPEIFRVKGDEITILRSWWTGQNVTPSPVIVRRSDLVPDNTVEGLFSSVEVALTDVDQRTSIDRQTVYSITLDPVFGFVTSYDVACEERSRASHDCPSETSMRIEVSDFKVLSRTITPTTNP
jgi:hypothetical protein